MRKLLIVLAVSVFTSLAASAGTIGPSCGSCFGGTYTLDAHFLSSSAGSESWRITYTLETQGVTDADVTYVGSIAAKVTSNMLAVTTVQNPTSTAGNWTIPSPGGLNSNGCSGSGSGWAC